MKLCFHHVAQESQTNKMCHCADYMTAIFQEMSYFWDLGKDFHQTTFLVTTGKDLSMWLFYVPLCQSVRTS